MMSHQNILQPIHHATLRQSGDYNTNQSLLNPASSRNTITQSIVSPKDKMNKMSNSNSLNNVDFNPFIISQEQKDYYKMNFKRIQPDEDKVMLGVQAKEILLKSNLPTRELSKIWELSDVDRDGNLSLGEFCIAFHLVVLKTHYKKYLPDLPKNLPEEMLNSLKQYKIQKQKSHPSAKMVTTTNPHLQPTLIFCEDQTISGPKYNLQNSSKSENFSDNNLYQINASNNNLNNFQNFHHYPKPDLQDPEQWETFSTVSTMSSISLVKFAPPGFPNNPNIQKPAAIRLTPSKISAAGGVNPWINNYSSEQQPLPTVDENFNETSFVDKSLSPNVKKSRRRRQNSSSSSVPIIVESNNNKMFENKRKMYESLREVDGDNSSFCSSENDYDIHKSDNTISASSNIINGSHTPIADPSERLNLTSFDDLVSKSSSSDLAISKKNYFKSSNNSSLIPKNATSETDLEESESKDLDDERTHLVESSRAVTSKENCWKNLSKSSLSSSDSGSSSYSSDVSSKIENDSIVRTNSSNNEIGEIGKERHIDNYSRKQYREYDKRCYGRTMSSDVFNAIKVQIPQNQLQKEKLPHTSIKQFNSDLSSPKTKSTNLNTVNSPSKNELRRGSICKNNLKTGSNSGGSNIVSNSNSTDTLNYNSKRNKSNESTEQITKRQIITKDGSIDNIKSISSKLDNDIIHPDKERPKSNCSTIQQSTFVDSPVLEKNSLANDPKITINNFMDKNLKQRQMNNELYKDLTKLKEQRIELQVLIDRLGGNALD